MTEIAEQDRPTFERIIALLPEADDYVELLKAAYALGRGAGVRDAHEIVARTFASPSEGHDT